MDSSEHMPHHDPDSGVVGTTQSLIVAFVLAMTFRGFVAEGFVIPTGSMAPTLLGEHHLIHSQLTGGTFPAGVTAPRRSYAEEVQIAEQGRRSGPLDPMLGPRFPLTGGLQPQTATSRAGDRILVLKGLYSFTEPRRWDVIVFKNPTDPKGEAGNYIKRLIGLPNETVWIADGDVFVKAAGEAAFRIQRKPEHIQRALWQPIHHSDFMLVQQQHVAVMYHGPPWVGEAWDTSGRSYRTFPGRGAEPTTLHWNQDQRSIDDWTAYNMLMDMRTVPVADLRVAAGIVAEQPGLATTLQLEARGHVYEFTVEDDGGRGRATVRFRSAQEEDWIDEASSDSLSLPPPGRVYNVEFWHVDQAMSVYINGRRVAHLEYEWSPMERLEHATGTTGPRALAAAANDQARTPRLEWHFSGSPVTLHRVRLDRDLHYRSASLSPGQQRNRPQFTGPAFGTHPENLARLGPDHFFMLGDNSQASLDSRLWGSPHPLVVHHLGDESPFVVHRKLLLGKAWVVYFPAPYWDGLRWTPDFGRLRYIR